MYTRTLAAALVSAAVPAILAAGCGGSGAAANDTPVIDRQAAALKYVRCLRAHGIDAEITTDGGIGVKFGVNAPQGGDGTSPGKRMLGPPPAMRRAEAACKKYAPKEGGTPEQRARVQQKALESALKFARCMRDHGISWPDPKATGNGIIQEGPSGMNPNDPALRRAMQACQKEAPGPDRGERSLAP